MVCASVMSQEYTLSRTHSGVSHRSHGSASMSTSTTSRMKQENLLFGEIVVEGDSTRSNSICNLVLTTSSAFLRFWLNDVCREKTLSNIPTATLPAIRLTCRDFADRAAPLLFSSASLTFRPSSLTRPARIAALERIGHHVQRFTFRFPHSAETFLPPLVDPNTGAQRPFTPDYRPQVCSPAKTTGGCGSSHPVNQHTQNHHHYQHQKQEQQPKYGSWELTDLLIRQYPPLFHAATNASAFLRAFEAMPNIQSLRIDCPDQDPRDRSRRSVVDYALISLRTAVESAPLPYLKELKLASMHPGGLLYLSPSPAAGFGAGGAAASVDDETPVSAVSSFSSAATGRAASRWKSITKLTMEMQTFPTDNFNDLDAVSRDHLKLLHAYLRHFAGQLTHFSFQWDALKSKVAAAAGNKKGLFPIAGPCPLTLDSEPSFNLSASLLRSPACYYSDSTIQSQPQQQHQLKKRRKKTKRKDLDHSINNVSREKVVTSDPALSKKLGHDSTSYLNNKLPPTPPATPTKTCNDGYKIRDVPQTTITPSPSPSSLTDQPRQEQEKSLTFPLLTHLRLDHCVASVPSLRAFFAKHAHILQSADFDNMRLHGGNWADATAPLLKGKGKRTRSQRRRKGDEKDEIVGKPSQDDGEEDSEKGRADLENKKKQSKRVPVLSFTGSSTMEVPIMLRLGTPDLSASDPRFAPALETSIGPAAAALREAVQSPPTLIVHPEPSRLPPATYVPASVEKWIDSSLEEMGYRGDSNADKHDAHRSEDSNADDSNKTSKEFLHPLYKGKAEKVVETNPQYETPIRPVLGSGPGTSLRYDKNAPQPLQSIPSTTTHTRTRIRQQQQQQQQQQHTQRCNIHPQLRTALSDPFIDKTLATSIPTPTGILPPPPPPPPPRPPPLPTTMPTSHSTPSSAPQPSKNTAGNFTTHNNNNNNNNNNNSDNNNSYPIIPHTILPPLDKLHQRNRHNTRKHPFSHNDSKQAHKVARCNDADNCRDGGDEHDHSHNGRCWLRRAKAPLVGCEGHVRKFIRGAVLGWR